MANRDFYPLVCDSPERVVIVGSFAPNGASAVSSASNKGDRGWTVARTSAGLFTITFDDLYDDMVYFGAELQLATGDDKYCQGGTLTLASKTMTVRVWDASAAAETDVAADDNNRINFIAVFRNTRLTP